MSRKHPVPFLPRQDGCCWWGGTGTGPPFSLGTRLLIRGWLSRAATPQLPVGGLSGLRMGR